MKEHIIYKYKNILYAILITAIVLGAFFIGVEVGNSDNPYFLTYKTSAYGLSNATPSDTDLKEFWLTWRALNEKFVGSTTPSSQEKIWGATQGLAASYKDPYTVFFPPEESKNFESDISGNFEGIGMEIAVKNGNLVVVAPLKDTPAYRAGIESGDNILAIDSKNTAGISTEEAVKMIRGPHGTIVKLTMLHPKQDKPVEISVTRDVINIPTVDTKKREDGVFVITVYNFSANVAPLFRSSLREFANSGSDKLVIDLRNNPGGFLDSAVDMASWFLPMGDVVVREDFGKNRDQEIHRGKGYDVFNDRLKMVVLVNGGSASASEILAGALQDHNKAVLVGEKTFGKGSVQELVDIGPKTSLKVTVARWLTPNGISISHDGLTPDVEVKMTQDDKTAKGDIQMQKAVDILTNGTWPIKK